MNTQASKHFDVITTPPQADVKKTPARFLLHPLVILSGMLAGSYIGFTNNSLAQKLAPLGEIYLALLTMCVLPIMIGAIVSSLGRMFSNKTDKRFLLSVVSVFAGGLLLASAVAIGVGLLISPGHGLDENNKIVLSGQVAQYELENESAYEPVEKLRLLDFITNIIPTNVFKAASNGQNLSLLFFSIVLGIAYGLSRTKSSETAIKVAEATYEAVLKIIGFLMYGLPLGLCFIVADQVSMLGIEIFYAMLKVILIIYLVSILMILIYSMIIWHRVGGTYYRSFYSLKDPLLISLGTSSSFAAIPSALKSLSYNFGLNKNKVDLVIPLGVSLNPHGNVIHFTLAAIFVAQLYGIAINAADMVVLMITAVLAAVAAAGAPGIAALSMLAIVFEPLGLPVSIGIILFAAIDPIIDPLLTMVNIHGNCASASLISEKVEKDRT